MKADLPSNEAARIAALRALKVLDTPQSDRFDRLTRTATRLFQTPVALVSLVDENRQWFKSACGLDASETDRDIAFCAHAILGDEVFVVLDATKDPTFADNPLVTGEPHIRFYAGAPLVTPDGMKIGTFCVIAYDPRDDFSDEDKAALQDLAAAAMDQLVIENALGKDVGVVSDHQDNDIVVAMNDLRDVFVTQSPAPMIMLDSEARIIAESEQWRRLWRKRPDTLVDGTDLRKAYPDIPERWLREMEHCLRSDNHSSGEQTINFNPGDTRVLQWEICRWQLSEGTKGTFLYVRDVTDRFLARSAVKESEQRHLAAYRRSPAMMHSIDADGFIIEVSDQWLEKLGYARERVMGRKAIEFLTPSSQEYANNVVQPKFLELGMCDDIPHQFVCENGEILDVLVTARAEWDEAGNIIRSVAVLTDVRDLKAAQQRAQQISAMTEYNPDAIIQLTEDNRVLYANAKGREFIATASSNGGFPGTGLKTGIDRAIAEEGKMEFDFHQAGTDYSTLIIPDLKTNQINIYARDVTAFVSATTQLRQSQKMETVGQLTGGIAHDFNNILSIALGNLQLVERRIKGDEQTQALIKTAKDASLRGANLTKQLLAFSRRQTLEPIEVKADELVDGMHSLITRAVGEAVDVIIRPGNDIWPTHIDASQLENAILNLSINARDAMPEGGRLYIESENCRITNDHVHDHDRVEPGEYVLITVTDTGGGMPADIREKIFEPFFTTKQTGKGTGLGLSMVFGFMKQSNGHITVYSEPDRGTVFRLYLPRTKLDTEAGTEPDQTSDDLPGGTETILLVEDDQMLQITGKMLLEDLGFTVITADHAAEALGILQEDVAFDLLFTDVVMPGGIDGFELVEQAKVIRPHLPALMTSGYPRKTALVQGDAELLPKPYQQDELALAVARALGKVDAA